MAAGQGGRGKGAVPRRHAAVPQVKGGPSAAVHCPCLHCRHAVCLRSFPSPDPPFHSREVPRNRQTFPASPQFHTASSPPSLHVIPSSRNSPTSVDGVGSFGMVPGIGGGGLAGVPAGGVRATGEPAPPVVRGLEPTGGRGKGQRSCWRRRWRWERASRRAERAPRGAQVMRL